MQANVSDLEAQLQKEWDRMRQAYAKWTQERNQCVLVKKECQAATTKDHATVRNCDKAEA